MTVRTLMLAANDRKSVLVPNGAMLRKARVLPAAFVIGWPFVHVVNMLPRLKLQPKKK